MGIGYAPEGRHLFLGLTVEDNLLMGAFHGKLITELSKKILTLYIIYSNPLRDTEKICR